MTRPLVLLTRPEQDAAPLAEALARLGIDHLDLPMLRIEAVEPPPALDFDGVQALIFTSANGVRHFARLSSRRDLPAYAVGAATAAELSAGGFQRIETGGGDARALLDKILQELTPSGGRLLHLAGETVAGDLAARLREQGFDCQRIALYRAIALDALTAEGRMALLDGRLNGVLLFSPRTARAFARLVQAAGLAPVAANLRAWCLSQPVAAEAAALPWRAVRVAPRPDQDSLLRMLKEDLELAEAGDTAMPPGRQPASNGEPERKPFPRESERVAPPPPERRSGSKRWLLLILLLLVALLSGVAYRFWPQAQAWLNPTPSAQISLRDPALEELKSRLDQIERQRAATPAQPAPAAVDLAPLRAEIERLAREAEQRKTQEARIAALEARPAGPSGNAGTAEIEQLRQQTEAMAERLRQSERADQRLPDAERRLAEIEERLNSIEKDIKAIADRRAAGGEEARKFGLLLGLMQLEQAIGRMQGYTPQIASLRELGAERLAPQAFAALAARANEGVPSNADLTRELARLAPAILRAERAAGEDAWWRRGWQRLLSLISVRRIGDLEGSDTEAALARAERRMEGGDVKAAAAEIASLSGPAAEAARPWLQRAELRLSLERALAELNAAALSQLKTDKAAQ